MATHSSILAWRIPWTEEPGGLQSMGLQRVRQNWATNIFTFTIKRKHWWSKWASDSVWSRAGHAEAGHDDVSYSLLTATSGRGTYWFRTVSKPGLRWYISHLLAMWRTSLVAQLVKNPPAMQKTPVWFLGQEDPLEKGQATHSSILGLPWWFRW